MSNHTQYGDWRDAIAEQYRTKPGSIIARPPVTIDSLFGLWVDSGIRTGDDALRVVIEIAENWGWDGVESEYRHLVDGDGWIDPETDPDGADILVSIADDAESFINAMISGFDPEIPDWIKRDNSDGFDYEEWNVYAGWDGDIGGFGLWAEPDEMSHVHKFGDWKAAPMTGNPNRECRFPGCKTITMDGDDDE